jgi:hypothetical protein
LEKWKNEFEDPCFPLRNSPIFLTT